MYSFGRACIAEGVITFEKLEDNTITLTESFLKIALECYKNIKIENGTYRRNNKSDASRYRGRSKR